jgi:hypothetical protein
MLNLVTAYNSPSWETELKKFLDNRETLSEKYRQKRKSKKITAKINCLTFEFSPGKHNQLQKNIVEDFAPIFAPGAIVLYIGDTEKKDLVKDAEMLRKLHIDITDHDKLPDVIMYLEERDWLLFIEAVVSVGPMSKKRVDEINKMTSKSKCGKVFITAFPDKKTFKSYADELAWETEVWIADVPDHMIHLDGEKFLGPY